MSSTNVFTADQRIATLEQEYLLSEMLKEPLMV
jgi:hypothetical protein